MGKTSLPAGRQGFTIFFAVLVASLALSVGLAVYSLLVRELALSQIATQSQYAIYAADAGVECALYWDNKYNGSSSAFATSSVYTPPPTGALLCNGQDITAVNSIVSNIPANSNAGWSVVSDSTYASTTFEISLGTATKDPCVLVEIGKYGDPNPATTIRSRGFNTCTPNAARVERALQVDY